MNPTAMTNVPDGARLARAKLLSCREVAQLLSVSKRTVLRMSARGDLPPPVRLGGSLPRWRLSDLQHHLDILARRQGRSAPGAAAVAGRGEVQP